MRVQSTENRHALQTALDSKNWKAVDRLLLSLPSQLPKNCDSALITASLEETRAAADALVQACDFRTAFEFSYATRAALVRATSVLSWATQAVTTFSFDERIVSRVAAVLGLLGMGSDGRAAVGCSGAVDKLTILWASHPTSVDIVNSLVSLCAGHIDNVSRTMRRRGISIAVQVLSDDDNREHISLIEQTVLYIGLCAICTPDMTREEHSVVPALLKILEDDLNLRRPRLLQHVLMGFGNILDCWTKEGFGYHLGDENRLIDAILDAWGSLRRSRDIAKSSSWALGSMIVGRSAQQTALRSRLEELMALAEPWRKDLKTCDFLYETADRVSREQGVQLQQRDSHKIQHFDADVKQTRTDGSPHKSDEEHGPRTRSRVSKRKRSAEIASVEKESGRGDERLASNDMHPSNIEECGADLTTSEIASVCDDEVSTPSVSRPRRCIRRSKKTCDSTSTASTEVDVTRISICRTKRRRIRSSKQAHQDNERSRCSARHAKRVPFEVIEISSEGEDDQGSPIAVRETCVRRARLK